MKKLYKKKLYKIVNDQKELTGPVSGFKKTKLNIVVNFY